jgi:PadR family transcriptional regulator, regulatory protein AphA
MLNLNATSYTILGGLSVQPDLSGYDIRKGIQQSIGYFWAESYGQIYPALKRLVREGLIAPSKARPNGRKRRQTYVLTDAGRAAMREWLALPFHNEPPRNEFLLKLFFAGEASPDVAIAHIQDLNERNRRWLVTIKTIEASIPPEQPSNPHLPYWMLTLSLGKAMTSAALEWGEKAFAALNAREASAAGSPQQPGTRTRKTSTSPRKQIRGKRGSTRSESKVSK